MPPFQWIRFSLQKVSAPPGAPDPLEFVLSTWPWSGDGLGPPEGLSPLLADVGGGGGTDPAEEEPQKAPKATVEDDEDLGRDTEEGEKEEEEEEMREERTKPEGAEDPLVYESFFMLLR